MEIIENKLFLFLMSTAIFSAASTVASEIETNEVQPRYLVFQGLDAESEEIGEWYNGYASPFNILFGPKPYVLGWLGQNSFDSGEDEEGEEEEEPDYEYENENGEGGENPEYEYEEI